jgi:hypothetical protein
VPCQRQYIIFLKNSNSAVNTALFKKKEYHLEISLTGSGYRRAVPRDTFIPWVEEAWYQIKTETIINSFNAIKNGIDEFEALRFT